MKERRAIGGTRDDDIATFGLGALSIVRTWPWDTATSLRTGDCDEAIAMPLTAKDLADYSHAGMILGQENLAFSTTKLKGELNVPAAVLAELHRKPSERSIGSKFLASMPQAPCWR